MKIQNNDASIIKSNEESDSLTYKYAVLSIRKSNHIDKDTKGINRVIDDNSIRSAYPITSIQIHHESPASCF